MAGKRGAQALGASRCSSSAPAQVEAREWRRRLRQRRRLMPRTRSLVARSGRSLGFGGIQPRAHESFEGSSVYSPLRLSDPLVGLARAFSWDRKPNVRATDPNFGGGRGEFAVELSHSRPCHSRNAATGRAIARVTEAAGPAPARFLPRGGRDTRACSCHLVRSDPAVAPAVEPMTSKGHMAASNAPSIAVTSKPQRWLRGRWEDCHSPTAILLCELLANVDPAPAARSFAPAVCADREREAHG